MKKLSSVLVGFFFLVLSFAASAQSKAGADYFNGKWSVLLKGIPSGDSKIFLILESRNDSIAGVVQDSTGTEVAKISKVELKDTEITVYFTAQGYDVSLLLTKKDDDHVKGILMGMFEAEGERIKVIK